MGDEWTGDKVVSISCGYNSIVLELFTLTSPFFDMIEAITRNLYLHFSIV